MRHMILNLLTLFFLLVSQVMNEEQRIAVCKTGLNQIYDMFRTSPQSWRNYLPLARSIISHLDSLSFMQQPSRIADQVWIIDGLQQLAYMDADSGAVVDISSWCYRQWLAIFERDPANIAALRGIGQSWQYRAQSILARIHRMEGSSSSSGASSSQSGPVRSSNNSERRPGSDGEGAERRTDTADYVEARQYLLPATEYFDRAVVAAAAQVALSGELLAMAAEAHMSLGNTSNPRINERCFRQAIQLLRQASAMPNYRLSRYLQQYLDEYGPLFD